ncbi:hypothetical protein FDP25_06945 [Roseovarius sp. A21]|uniref:Uncharacterized protein n=1 Tax=Roseovarius bejariae TaxID=2576383 RepID=A0A844CYQ5_9RHOB|nr:hypothetical protein [Roseovarius bejariae]MRU15164.1 hypothetical protein [Roseovarius bejariae]
MTAPLHDMQDAPEWAQLGIVPGVALRAFGMRRSGNHAIADWIMRNAPGDHAVFLNNCKPGASPLDSFASIEVDGEKQAVRRARGNLPGETTRIGDGALLLVSYEDLSPADFGKKRQVSGAFNADLFDFDILIYRSFLNWSASLIKKLQSNPGYGPMRRVAIMLNTADRYARMLELVGTAPNNGMVPICYDRWFVDGAYREGVLGQLGLPVRDNAVGEVQSYGGGSSFQKDAAAPEELQTSERWRQMAQDADFRAFLSIAAREMDLMAQVEAHFPEDAARLIQGDLVASVSEG